VTSGVRAPEPLRSRPYLARPPRTRQKPPETQNAPEPAQKPYRARAVRWRVWWRAHRPAYQTAPHSAPALRARQRPERARNHQKPGPHQKPGRRQPEALPRARRPLARMVARAPTGVPDRTAFRAKRFAPEAAQIADAANRGSGKSRKRQIADAANRGSIRIQPKNERKKK